MAKKSDHVHKYERVEVGKNKWIVYRCTLPNCTHYLPNAELIVGRQSLCWGLCGGTTIYSQDDYNRKLKQPMCAGCRAIRQAQKDQLRSVPVGALLSDQEED